MKMNFLLSSLSAQHWALGHKLDDLARVFELGLNALDLTAIAAYQRRELHPRRRRAAR
jgi:hypothetical protein